MDNSPHTPAMAVWRGGRELWDDWRFISVVVVVNFLGACAFSSNNADVVKLRIFEWISAIAILVCI